MYIHFEYSKLDDTGGSGFTREWTENYIRTLGENLEEFITIFKDELSNRIGIEFLPSLTYCMGKSVRAIDDTINDLKRIKEFHPVKNPNGIKLAAYTAYWWNLRKPMVVPNSFEFFKDLPASIVEEQGERLSSYESWLENINELFCAHYILTQVFDVSVMNPECPCDTISEMDLRKFNLLSDYLYYYMCYRVKSAQSLELFIMGLLLHPKWQVGEEFDFGNDDSDI